MNYQDPFLRALYGEDPDEETVVGCDIAEAFTDIASWLSDTATVDHVETAVGGWRFTMTRLKRQA
jgi:hypothetical protein